ncbi:response regulator transcription factor [Streptomyces sp. NPDC049597]|uniref:response regulator transcription factor n=1 Tax=Streptomyces sp. NPDC049597 TaxID=3155276 RepID=UPI0034360F5B
MPDESSRTSGQFIAPHASQHTSSHATPLHSDPPGGAEGHGPQSAPPFPPPAPLRVVVADDNPVVRAGLTVLLGGRDDIHVVAEAADGRQAMEAAERHRPDVILLDVRMPGVDGISALPHLVQAAPVMMLTYSRESAVVQEALRLGAGGYLVHGEFTADQLVAAVRDVREGRAHFTATAANALLAEFRVGHAPGPRGGQPLPDGLGTAYAPPAPPPGGHPAPPPHPAAPIVSTSRNPGEDASHLQSNMGQSSVRHGGDAGSSAGVPQPACDKDRFGLSSREAEVMDLIASGMSNQQIAATCFISEKTVKNHINRIFAKLHSVSRSEAIAVWIGTARGDRVPGRGRG